MRCPKAGLSFARTRESLHNKEETCDVSLAKFTNRFINSNFNVLVFLHIQIEKPVAEALQVGELDASSALAWRYQRVLLSFTGR